MKTRLTTLLLAVLITVSLTPVSAAAAAHFTDVPPSYWAYQYVERAYADGAIVGTGGDPAKGTGVFSPDREMTYGEFLTMLVNAFYRDELSRAGSDGPWYAPAIRVAVDRGIVTEPLGALMEDADAPVDRYTAARILVRLMDDKCVVLPDEAQRKEAAASIGDWEAVEGRQGDEAAESRMYYVASIYAMGVMSGVDSAGTFAGSDPITRASAAALYTVAAEKLRTSQNDPSAFHIEFVGDWDGVVPEGYKEGYEKAFYTVFPRLWTRWGNANVSKHITLRMVPQEDLIIDAEENRIALGDTSCAYDAVRQRYNYSIRFSIEVINSEPWNAGLLAHELSHAATNHYPLYSSSWWLEAIADYGYFRYCAWADEDYAMMEQYYEPDDEKLRTYFYCDNEKADVKMPWFLAYLDEKYPTSKTEYGLVDSLHRAMRTGQVHSDGGTDQGDADFNAVVKRVTGYDNIELLRQRFIRELDEGTWTFEGFAGFPDNFITEGLAGVPDPSYPGRGDYNLCAQAKVSRVSGEASEEFSAYHMIDGNYSTKWSAAEKDVVSREGLLEDAQHIICVELKRPVTIDTYTLYHEGSQGGGSLRNTAAWRLWYWDIEKEAWIMIETVKNNTKDITTREIDPIKTQRLWLDIIKPSRTGDGVVRLYEIELFHKN